jgi:hypothetical protein
VPIFGDGEGDILTVQMMLCETINPYGDKILRQISGEAMKWYEQISTRIV